MCESYEKWSEDSDVAYRPLGFQDLNDSWDNKFEGEFVHFGLRSSIPLSIIFETTAMLPYAVIV